MSKPPEGLEATQRFFGDAIRQFVPLTEHAGLAGDIRAVIAGNDRLTPEEQAEIYREQFWLRHRDVLREDFPTLRHLLGEDGFDDFARAYLTACPPDSYTLRDLGNRLADFAARHDGFAPSLAGPARDVACFELAFVDIFDGPEVTPIDAAAVEGIPPEAWPEARLSLRPRLTLVRAAYPVHRYRDQVKADEEPPPPDAEPTIVALWRGADLRVHYRPISPPEAGLVDALRAGATLGEAIATVAEGLGEAEEAELGGKLGAWFQGWAQRGWIVAVEIPETSAS